MRPRNQIPGSADFQRSAIVTSQPTEDLQYLILVRGVVLRAQGIDHQHVEARHEAALETLAGNFGTVCSSTELLALLRTQ